MTLTTASVSVGQSSQEWLWLQQVFQLNSQGRNDCDYNKCDSWTALEEWLWQQQVWQLDSQGRIDCDYNNCDSWTAWAGMIVTTSTYGQFK